MRRVASKRTVYGLLAGLLALAGASVAADARVRHHRVSRAKHYSRGAPGAPITSGSSLVRINGVGQVIAPVVTSKMPEVK